MNSFDKKIFHYLGLSLMGIVKFSVWLNIPSKYRGFICHCFCYCGYIFKKINWHILPEFSPLFFVVSLAVVKSDVECLTE